MHGRKFGVFVRGKKLGVMKGEARWESVKLGGRRASFVRKKTSFARRSYAVSERGRKSERGE